MNLDVEVAMLKPMKAHRDSKRYKWHHRLRKYFPEEGEGRSWVISSPAGKTPELP